MNVIDQISMNILQVHQRILSPLDQLLENEEKDSPIYFFVEKIKRFSGFSRLMVNRAPDELIYGVGSPSSIIPFVDSIITGKIKVWRTNTDNNGQRNKRLEKRIKAGKKVDWNKRDMMIGHFRTSFKAHILSPKDIEKLKRFFYGTYINQK